jgi:hypothetical protein
MLLKPSALMISLSCVFISISHAAPLDITQIKTISLTINGLDNINLSSDKQTISQQVIKNLTEQRFPLITTKASHVLNVSISAVEHASTPTGFSFSMGNSDPRAGDFQKADVYSVQCQLTDNNNSQHYSELSNNFNANLIKANTLSDNISSVCYSVLDELHFLKAEQLDKPAIKSTWLPSVKIETVPAKTIVTPVNNTVDTIKQPPKKIVVEPEAETKQLIIHNQGTPLIFKMGHERN